MLQGVFLALQLLLAKPLGVQNFRITKVKIL